MKRDRYFYTTVSALIVLLTVIGFRRFFAGGRGFDGGTIPPALLALVITHGLAITAWMVLFFVESLLIASKNRRLHMKLGWGVACVALLITVSGPTVAIASPRLRGNFPIFGMNYSQFILPMFCEIAAFTLFVGLGILNRKRAAMHRSMMLMATLSVLSGATSRTPAFAAIFGENGWVGLFGPVFTIGALILIARAIVTRSLDRPLAVGLAGLACAYILAMNVAVGETWTHLGLQIARVAPPPTHTARVVEAPASSAH